MALPVTIVTEPTRTLMGLKVRTSMDKAAIDCPAVWQQFMPRLHEVSLVGDQAYGVSVAAEMENIDYFALVEVAQDATLPAGMEAVTLPGGLYACCTALNLSKIPTVYMWLYEGWERTQREYVLDRDAPCFEAYPSNWQESSSLNIYAPVRKR